MKLWFLLLACAVLCLGCVPRREGTTVVRFAFWGSIEQQEIERRIAGAFEAENPGIRIELVPIGGSRYAEKIQAMMVGRVAPDVLMVEINQYLEWASRGALVDLTEDVEMLTADNPLMPLPAMAFAKDGRFYAVPVNCSGQAMYVNLDALKKAGVTPAELRSWEDLLRIAPRLSRRAGDPGAPTDYALLMPAPLIPFWAYGGALFDSPTKPSEVTVRTPEARAALEFLRAVHGSGYAVPPDVSSDQGTYQLFRDGKVALYFDGRWRTPDFAGKTNFAWDVFPMPSGPGGQVTQHGGTGLAISKDSRQVEAARKFVRFYASEKGAALAATGGRYVPVYRKMAFAEEFLGLRPPENIRVFAETMEKDRSRIAVYTAGTAQVRDIFGSRVEQVLSEPDKPMDDILKGLDEDLRRWLRRQKQKGLL
jgi:multiple sugar transport system substrate-binding protein